MKNINTVSFRQDMRELRSGKYGELIDKIRKQLELGDNVSNASMEALFIMATEDVFSDEIYKARSVLVVLSLVRGYSRHEIHELAGKKNSAGQRRKQFFDEIGETEISLDTQRQNDGRWINEVADHLCKLYVDGKIESYLKEAGAKYKSSATNYIPNDELPTLSDIGKRPVMQDGLMEKSSSVDTEQGANDDPISSSDEVNECELETLTDDKQTPMPLPNSPNSTEESFEEKSSQDSTLSIKEKIIQYTKNLYNAFWDVSKGGEGFGVKIAIIFVIVVIIFARYVSGFGDSDPPVGELFIRDPEGTEKSEYNFTLDAGKGTVINIYGMPDDADIEDLEIWIRPEDTDLIEVEPIPADTPQILPLLIRAQGIKIGEVENWEDECKINTVTIVVIYKKATPVYMNVTVESDSGSGFSTELLENGGED